MADTENTETNKNPGSKAGRRAALFKRREGLFRKAYELSVLCEADVGVITISDDGIVNEFSSSSMQNLITRYKGSLKFPNICDLSSPEEPKEEVSKEADVAGQSPEKQEIKQNFLGKDLECMTLRELFVLQGELSKGLFCIKDRKIQLLREELQESRLKEQDVSQRNQILLREIEEIQRLGPVYFPAPLAVRFPEREGDTNTELLPSTSFANGHETEYAEPMAIDYAPPVVPEDRDTPARPDVDTGLRLSLWTPSYEDCGEYE